MIVRRRGGCDRRCEDPIDPSSNSDSLSLLRFLRSPPSPRSSSRTELGLGRRGDLGGNIGGVDS
jgi:hypothetical protein